MPNLPIDSAYLPAAVFVGVALVFFLIGRILIGLGRSRNVKELNRTGTLVFGPLTQGLAGVIPMPKRSSDLLNKELKQAGFYRPMAREQFLAIRNVLVVGWILLTGITVVVAMEPTNDPTSKILIAGFIVMALLYAAPRLYLQTLAKNRVVRIQTGLPDALDMTTMCMTGGLPLQKALGRVSEEIQTSHPDIALELEIIRRQADAYSLEQALRQFSERIDVSEVRSLAALVSQTERLGTNVASALRDYSDSIRRLFRQRAEEQGNKSSVKMILPISLCLAPAIYILLLSPAILELREFVVRENQPGGILDPVEVEMRQSVISGQTLEEMVDEPFKI